MSWYAPSLALDFQMAKPVPRGSGVSSIYMVNDQLHSVAEVEVVISVAIIFALTETSANEVEREWDEGNSAPDTETEVDDPSLDDEAFETSVHEVEEPLLSGI